MIDIDYISKLAELKLTNKEKLLFKKQLEEVISYINQLNKINKSDINFKNVYKNVTEKDNDKISNSLDVKDALKNSHSTYNDLFKVKLVLKNKII